MSKNVWEREGSTSTSKTEVTVRSCCKKQFEKKKNFAKGAKLNSPTVHVAKEFGDKFSQVIKNLRSSLRVCIVWFSGSWEI